jgi:glycosyltransferase involved in cell wall biosynthesis
MALPQLPLRTETFLGSYLARLPFSINLLLGDGPCWDEHGQRVFGRRWHEHVLNRLRGRANRTAWRRRRAEVIGRWLSDKTTACVLADYGPTAVAIMEACRVASVPLVARFHGYDAYKHGVLRRLRQDYMRLFEDAFAVVAVSRHMKEQLIGLGAVGAKVHYIPSGTDMNLFTPGNPGGCPPRFLAVGRFVPKKGPLLTLAAFARVAEAWPAARLTMIGDGPLLQASKQTAHVLGIGDKVCLPGPLDHRQVRDVMQRCRAFVQHSVLADDGDAEGTPNAIVEAHASGLPVVATAHGGIVDVVRDEESGFLVREGDVEAMADSMLIVARDPQRAAAMGQIGRRHVEQAFSLERSLELLTGVLRAGSQNQLQVCRR